MELINNRLVAGITEVIPGKDQSPGYFSSLRIVDLEGMTIMHHDVPEWQLQALKASDDGNFLAASFYKSDTDENQTFQFQTTIFEETGNVVYRIPASFQQAIFNENSDRILLIDKNTCYLYDILNKTRIGIYKTHERGTLFLAATFLPPSNMVVLEEGKPGMGKPGTETPWAYDNIYIRIVDENGKELNDILIENITIFKPAFRFNKEDQTLFIGHSTGWQLYRIEF